LLSADSEGWVPEHFYAEVLGVFRRRLLIERTITESQATAAVGRLGLWHLHRASVAPLVPVAWKYRRNMTAADALYVALSEEIGGDLLTDDYKLVASPNFPPGINCSSCRSDPDLVRSTIAGCGS
jgi:predicted nucleic acid-binding protein